MHIAIDFAIVSSGCCRFNKISVTKFIELVKILKLVIRLKHNFQV